MWLQNTNSLLYMYQILRYKTICNVFLINKLISQSFKTYLLVEISLLPQSVRREVELTLDLGLGHWKMQPKLLHDGLNIVEQLLADNKPKTKYKILRLYFCRNFILVLIVHWNFIIIELKAFNYVQYKFYISLKGNRNTLTIKNYASTQDIKEIKIKKEKCCFNMF